MPKFQGGGYSATGKVTKYQDLPKYEFSGEGGGYSATGKVTKYQDLPKYEFS